MYRTIVVDDSDEFREWFKSLLESSDEFDVIGETDKGLEAIELAGGLQPDVMVIDVFMQDIDGIEVARHIHEIMPNIRTVLVSANAGSVYNKLAEEQGALAFIPKISLSVESLLEALNSEPGP